MGRKIIFFELNEVPLKIFDHYVKLFPDSHLNKVINQSKRFETYTEDKGHLSPWVTWPTLHRGVTNENHFISDFGQNTAQVDKEFPPVWQILANNGIKTGVCSSLHTYPLPDTLNNYTFFIPDPFAETPDTHPKSIEPFQKFSLSMSRKSARNVDTSIPMKEALGLAFKLPGLGVKMGTMTDLASQMVGERLKKWKVVRRRTYQSVLSFDVFMKQLNKTKPDFSSFFTNHVASSLHRYWAASFPKEYENLEVSDEWIRTFSEEIIFTMNKADAMVGRLIHFCKQNKDYDLWIVSSMGQEATQANSLETQLYVKHADQFMKAMGVNSGEWSEKPCMLPQFNVAVDDSKADIMEASAQSLQVAGEPIQYRRAENFFSFDFGHANLKNDCMVSINGQSIQLTASGLENVEIQDKSGTTAYHIPQGSFFIYNPEKDFSNIDQTQVSTLDIAPGILHNFGIQAPDYMSKPSNIL